MDQKFHHSDYHAPPFFFWLRSRVRSASYLVTVSGACSYDQWINPLHAQTHTHLLPRAHTR